MTSSALTSIRMTSVAFARIRMTESFAVPIARLHGVTKRYGNVVALNDVDIVLNTGVTALLGPNGAGKTTTVKLVLGLARPTAGTVTVCGADPRRSSTRERIGAMLQVGRVPESLRV